MKHFKAANFQRQLTQENIALIFTHVVCCLHSGAMIGDGDRKRAPLLIFFCPNSLPPPLAPPLYMPATQASDLRLVGLVNQS